jgi:hypothetical protein
LREIEGDDLHHPAQGLVTVDAAPAIAITASASRNQAEDPQHG